MVALKNQQITTSASVDNAKKLLDAEFQRFEIGESSLFLVNSREIKYIELLLKSYELKSKFFIKTIKVFNLFPFNGCRNKKIRRKKMKTKRRNG